MRTGDPLRRIIGGSVLVIALSSCSASGGDTTAGTSAPRFEEVGDEIVVDRDDPAGDAAQDVFDEINDTVDHPDDLGESADEKFEDVGNAIEGSEAIPVDECIDLADDLSYPDSDVAPSWSAAQSPIFMHNIDDYRAEDLERLPPIADSLDPALLEARWSEAGFSGASWFWTYDGDPPVDVLVSDFGSHEDAVAAAKVYLADLCVDVSAAVPLQDRTGLSLTSTYGTSKTVYVAGPHVVDLTDATGGALDGRNSILESWRAEMTEAMEQP